MTANQIIAQIAGENPQKPVLIAGCTASGKSALALQIAATCGGVIVNADSMQVYENWSILTARPDARDMQMAKHLLYGHVPRDVAYSVGDWLKDIMPILHGADRPIIVGGTGLFFRALLEGLANIPPTPPHIRQHADALMAQHGVAHMAAALDAQTRAAIDLQNPARVQRAWEVQEATGTSITTWHARTPPALVNLDQTTPLLLDAPVAWIDTRIATRFDIMLQNGAMAEAQENLATWDPTRLSSKAIGAPELMAHLAGDLDFDAAKAAAVLASRQYAKRQRTWFRKRMKDWIKITPNV